MMEVNIKDLLEAGAHFGHQKERWNPKMRPFIFATRDNVHIIDLEKTVEYADKALKFVNEIVKSGGKILFVGTKRQAKDLVKKAAEDCKMPYVTNRWLGGLLTNFETIRKRLKRLKDLENQKTSGEFAKFTKREQMILDKEIEKLEGNFGGIRELTTLPQALFVIDMITEEVAVKEALNLHIPIIALVDSNANPDLVQYPIPSNDDAIKTIEYFCKLMTETINAAQNKKIDNENDSDSKKEKEK
jgi:small subunit ribosomal protein S2